MPYAFVHDIAASWHEYDHLASLGPAPPPGLLVHVAGPTDEGFRVIEVWESEDAWQRAREAGLWAALEALDETLRPAALFRDLRPLDLVLGPVDPDPNARRRP